MIGGIPLVFSIEVPRRKRKDRFDSQDLLEEARIYHHGCEGGRANLYRGKFPKRSRWKLMCPQCSVEKPLFIFDKERIDICKTALDGKERKLASDIRVRRGDTIGGD